MTGEWRRLKDRLADQTSKLKEASRHSDKFQGDLETLEAWLDFSHERLVSAAPMGLDKETVARQLKEAQGMQAEVLRKSRDHETLNSEAAALMESSDVGQEAIRDKLDTVNQRWEVLSSGVQDRVSHHTFIYIYKLRNSWNPRISVLTKV